MFFRKKKISDVSDDLRTAGIKDEESFWESFVTSERFISNWCTSSPNPELNLEVELLIKVLCKHRDELKMLDIGSGPVSILSRCSNSQKIFLQSVDPLANFYRKILPKDIEENFDVSIPRNISAEDLTEYFDKNFFDLVHIRNALDHTVDPIKSIGQMFEITKVGGFILIHGFENEALWENWVGMHQWNLSIRNDFLIISDKNDNETDSLQILGEKVRVVLNRANKLPNGKTWITYILEKISD